MNRAQKIAWFNLIVVAITIVVTVAAVIALTLSNGMPWALYGLGFGGIIVFSLISPLIFRGKKHKGQVSFDERDAHIHRRALQASDSASCGLFLAVCIGVFLVVGLSGLVPAAVLPMMVCWAFTCGKLAESIAILVQYGREGKGEKS
jgi:hypothetical protein